MGSSYDNGAESALLMKGWCCMNVGVPAMSVRNEGSSVNAAAAQRIAHHTHLYSTLRADTSTASFPSKIKSCVCRVTLACQQYPASQLSPCADMQRSFGRLTEQVNE